MEFLKNLVSSQGGGTNSADDNVNAEALNNKWSKDEPVPEKKANLQRAATRKVVKKDEHGGVIEEAEEVDPTKLKLGDTVPWKDGSNVSMDDWKTSQDFATAYFKRDHEPVGVDIVPTELDEPVIDTSQEKAS